MIDHQHCPENQDFVKAVTDLATTVEIQANNVRWIEKGARYVGALCLAVVGLIIVGLFYAGALHKQVQINAEEIRALKEFHVTGASNEPHEIRTTPTHAVQISEI